MSQTAAQHQTPSVFHFESNEVRSVKDEQGNPWWVAKDVCEILGYANHNDAISKVAKGVAKRYPLLTQGGVQHLRIIAEPDLYRLIAGSRLPAAVRFEKWIFEEVLPSIRKTGGYTHRTPRSMAEIDEIAGCIRKTKNIITDYMALSKSMGAPRAVAAPAAVDIARKITGFDCSNLLPAKFAAEQEYHDPAELLSDILNADIRMGDAGPVSVAEAISMNPVPGRMFNALIKHGLKLIDGRHLFVAPDRTRSKLLGKTKWKALPIRDILMQLPGAEKSRLRLAGNPERGVLVRNASDAAGRPAISETGKGGANE